MTTAAPRTADAAISAAVWALLSDHDEKVADLAHFTRISVAGLYRKLGGQAAWKAADIAAVAGHYRLDAGELFRGAQVTGGRRGRSPIRQPVSGPTREYVEPQGVEVAWRPAGGRRPEALARVA